MRIKQRRIVIFFSNVAESGSKWLVQFLERERDLLLSRFLGVRTVGSLQAKKYSCST